MYIGDCSNGKAASFLAKPSAWADVDKKVQRIITHRATQTLQEPSLFLLPIFKMWKSVPLKLLQSRVGAAQGLLLGQTLLVVTYPGVILEDERGKINLFWGYGCEQLLKAFHIVDFVL